MISKELHEYLLSLTNEELEIIKGYKRILAKDNLKRAFNIPEKDNKDE